MEASRVAVDRGRIALQKDAFENLTAGGSAQVWLFLIDPGHFRVFSDEELRSRFDLLDVNASDPLLLETQEERLRWAALSIRLIPTGTVPERRLKLPHEAFALSGELLDRTHVWLVQCPAVHVYMATYVHRLLALPPGEVLPRLVDAGPDRL